MQASSAHHMSNYKAQTWDYKGSKSFGFKFLLLDHHLDGYNFYFIGCYLGGYKYYYTYSNLLTVQWILIHAKIPIPLNHKLDSDGYRQM
jgi:hypothetical protein